MISSISRSSEWIHECARRNNISDLGLLEKAIRALCLLESLVRSGCPLIWKGGSALMLHLDSARRLSVDIDVICPPGTDIEKYLGIYAEEYGFHDVQLTERKKRIDIPKVHAKYFYKVSYLSGDREDKILLDVLFEEPHYKYIDQLPIQGRLLQTDGEPVLVNVPSKDELLGDKLTAFAHETTGIPYFKGPQDCSMEIIKQLFDVASLFDVIDDISQASETYRQFAKTEMAYRNLELDTANVLRDTIHAAAIISMRGQLEPDKYELLQGGISRIRAFIHSESFSLDKAILCASKAAYLAAMMISGKTKVERYSLESPVLSEEPEWPDYRFNKFNKFKKTSPEVFYYWAQTAKLLSR